MFRIEQYEVQPPPPPLPPLKLLTDEIALYVQINY